MLLLLYCVGVKGGTNVAPELAEVGSVIKREGFAVVAADAARGPGGGAIVLPDGLGDLAPKHEKPRKVRRSVIFSKIVKFHQN